MTNPAINQFSQLPIQGQLDLSQVGGNVISARVSNNIGNGIVLTAGQAVKIDATAPGTAQDGVPAVLPLASDTDIIFGFVKYSIKDQSFGVNARVEIALSGTVMYETADATSVPTVRMGPLEYNSTANTVRPALGVNPVCGFAFDAAVNAGDLIRVWISAPAFQPGLNATKNLNVVATLAQINAGLVLIPGVSGKKITVTDYTARVIGAFTTGTSVELESTNASPVAVSTVAEAALTNGAILKPTSANTTLGAGFAIPLGSGDGLQVVNNGSAQAGGTSITFNITYTQQ